MSPHALCQRPTARVGVLCVFDDKENLSAILFMLKDDDLFSRRRLFDSIHERRHFSRRHDTLRFSAPRDMHADAPCQFRASLIGCAAARCSLRTEHYAATSTGRLFCAGMPTFGQWCRALRHYFHITPKPREKRARKAAMFPTAGAAIGRYRAALDAEGAASYALAALPL